ncbi:hypothetical protein OZX56_05405 [Lactobacillus sp. ESL0684]|uniref:hypothetical protein n=1 Tax=Lactobacillus sp. ESL0684 TaxID=2983213 RepID=UPI0023F7EAAB|nr:hypothetical protein [Lactobacillus sp. ESL0684]WEV42986.1 hypothetical protein OZX56_05405 [Lactobacillus sp. ESL0684]
MVKLLKRKKDNYVNISQRLISDDRLSWKARGIFAYLWGQADNWQFYVSELVRHATDGKKSLQGGLLELERFGYLERNNKHTDKGVFGGKEWILTDEPNRQPHLTVDGQMEQNQAKKCQTTVDGETRRTVNGSLTNINNNYYQEVTNKNIQCKPDKQVMHNVKDESIKNKTQEFNQQVKGEFEKLWDHYPNKKGKQQAFNHYKSWRKKSKANTYKYLANKLVDYLKYVKLNSDWYHPMNGSTWFNGRFDDELDTDKPSGKSWGPVKRIEHGTDWSNKKAKPTTEVNSDKLKDFFKNLEEKSGMNKNAE